MKQKQNWSPPPSSSIPMHMVHRVTKAATFFLACFPQFFSVVVFLFVHRDAKDGFLFFPIFSFPFFVDFLFHAFFLLTQYGSKLD